jgi:hypothetical protein
MLLELQATKKDSQCNIVKCVLSIKARHTLYLKEREREREREENLIISSKPNSWSLIVFVIPTSKQGLS